jgi:hypothetical protein
VKNSQTSDWEKCEARGVNTTLPRTGPKGLQDFYRREYVKLYDAAQTAITELRCGSSEEAERILLRAGIEDPDAEPQNEPDRKEED